VVDSTLAASSSDPMGVAMTGLRPGLVINFLSPGCGPDQVQIGPGVYHPTTADSPLAMDAAYLAGGPWRGPSEAERNILFASRPLTLSASVSVLDLGSQLLGHLRDLLLPQVAVRVGVLGEGDPIETATHILPQAQGLILQALTDRHGVVPEEIGPVDLVINRPGLLSTAIKAATGACIGLHIDTHEPLPLTQRRSAMTLCAANIGAAERYLDFINLPVRQIVASLAGSKVPVPETAPALKDAFLLTYPDYPVVRITVPPGQAYLCNTQDTIHDGSTNLSGLPDIVLLTLNRWVDEVPGECEAEP
jgi:hypothetical protein